MNKSDLAKALWTTIVDSYNQGGRTKVDLPVEDVVAALCALTANVISQVPTARERMVLLARVPVMVDRMLDAAGDKPHLHIASRGKGLILPAN